MTEHQLTSPATRLACRHAWADHSFMAYAADGFVTRDTHFAQLICTKCDAISAPTPVRNR